MKYKQFDLLIVSILQRCSINSTIRYLQLPGLLPTRHVDVYPDVCLSGTIGLACRPTRPEPVRQTSTTRPRTATRPLIHVAIWTPPFYQRDPARYLRPDFRPDRVADSKIFRPAGPCPARIAFKVDLARKLPGPLAGSSRARTS